MNKDYTHITVVQDKSGSMGAVRAETIAGFNTFIQDQKRAPGKCTFSFMQFDTNFKMLNDFEDIQNVEPLTESTFVPGGFTALLDATGRMIVTTGQKLESLPEAERPAKVIFAILTDGEENASKEYGGESGRAKIFEMIKHQTEVYKWQFVFLGANQDAIKAGADMGIGLSNSMSTANNAEGVKEAYAALSSNTRSFRSAAPGGASSMAFSVHQRAAQYDAGAAKDAMADAALSNDPQKTT